MYCNNCGVERHPVSKPGNCQACRTLLDRERFKIQWREDIEKHGYDFIEYLGYNGSHTKVKVTNHECGHTFIAAANNIISRRTICGECGPTKRMKSAFDAWYEKNKRTYDLQKWKDYTLLTRHLSNQTYTKHKNMLNPMGLPRRKANAHTNAVNLDHIIPIIYGFKNQVY